MRLSIQFCILLLIHATQTCCTTNHRKIRHGNDHSSLEPEQRFSQVTEKAPPGLLSLMFHGPVTPRALDIGIEDSNKGLLDAIKLNEDEQDVNRILNAIEKREQNQVDSFYKDFQIQNAGLEEINTLLTE